MNGFLALRFLKFARLHELNFEYFALYAIFHSLLFFNYFQLFIRLNLFLLAYFVNIIFDVLVLETRFLISYFKNIYTFSDLIHFYFFLLKILFLYIIILVFQNPINFFIFFNSKNQIFWNLLFSNCFVNNYNSAN